MENKAISSQEKKSAIIEANSHLENENMDLGKSAVGDIMKKCLNTYTIDMNGTSEIVELPSRLFFFFFFKVENFLVLWSVKFWEII
jgi:hypothetical protein